MPARNPAHAPVRAALAGALAAGLLLLGVAPTQAAELHTPHCLYGCPTVGLAASTDIIVRSDYTLASNDETKFADWVAYRVTPAMFGGNRPRNWAADPLLAPDETLEPEDYTGAHAALGTDRGHMAPLATFGGTQRWETVNYLSNITPQSSALNQGPWRVLEDAIREAAERNPALELYVVTGSAYNGDFGTLPQADEPHRIPTAFWKLVAAPSVDERGRTRIEAMAFLLGQDAARGDHYCSFATDLIRLQTAAGMTFFHGLDARPDIRVIDDSALLRGALGCGES